jgi:hypothetical protein
MEKVLRKVKCSDRLPNFQDLYFVKLFNGEKSTSVLYPHMDKEDLSYLDRSNPEFWYEEVSLDELLILERQKYLTELADSFKNLIPNDLQQNLAKERYEKALKYINEYHKMVGMNLYVETPIVFKALKIAAGIEED